MKFPFFFPLVKPVFILVFSLSYFSSNFPSNFSPNFSTSSFSLFAQPISPTQPTLSSTSPSPPILSNTANQQKSSTNSVTPSPQNMERKKSPTNPATPSPQNMERKKSSTNPATPDFTGWFLFSGGGLNLCIPNGESDCDEIYPGLVVNLGGGYRWTYIGLSIDYDYGSYWISGVDSDHISNSLTHFQLMVRGYLPMNHYLLFLGGGVGYGKILIQDEESKSEVSWSSLLKSIKITTGILLPLKLIDRLDVLVKSNLSFHQGGQRCTQYNQAGPCIDIDRLDTDEQDISMNLQIITALEYTF